MPLHRHIGAQSALVAHRNVPLNPDGTPAYRAVGGPDVHGVNGQAIHVVAPDRHLGFSRACTSSHFVNERPLCDPWLSSET